VKETKEHTADTLIPEQVLLPKKQNQPKLQKMHMACQSKQCLYNGHEEW